MSTAYNFQASVPRFRPIYRIDIGFDNADKSCRKSQSRRKSQVSDTWLSTQSVESSINTQQHERHFAERL